MKLGVGLATTEGRMSSPCVGRRRLGEIGRPPGCRTRADARAGAGNGELMRAREGNKRERVARGGKQARESAREAEYILPRGGKGKRPCNLGVPAVERERRRKGKRRVEVHLESGGGGGVYLLHLVACPARFRSQLPLHARLLLHP